MSVDGTDPTAGQPAAGGADGTADHEARLGRNAGLMTAGTLVSRLLGFVRNALLVAAIGVTAPAANAFDVANKLPNFIYAILAGGVLNVVLVPQIVKAYKSAKGQDFVDRLLTLTVAGLLAITVAMTAVAGVIVDLYVTNWSPELTALAVAFALWCIPQLFFYGLYTVLGQVLNARGQFGPYMWAPVVNNVVAIAGLLAYLAAFGPVAAQADPGDLTVWTGGRIALLAGVATAGVAAQALVLLVPLYRSGFRWRPRWGIRGSGLGSAGRVATWTFASVLLDALGVLVTTNVQAAADAAAGDGVQVASNAAYTNAMMLYLLPHSLVTVSLATALFTRISAAASDRDTAGVRRAFSLGVRTTAVFTVFATVAMTVLAVPIVRVLVPSASADETAAVSGVLVALLTGLVALGGMVMIKPVYFAYEDGRSIFWIQVPMNVVFVGVSLLGTVLLEPRWWVIGVAVGLSLGNWVTFVLRLVGLRSLLGRVDGRRIVSVHVRSAVAAAVAGGVGWALLALWGVSPELGFAASLLRCAVVGVVMLVLYLLGLRLLKVRELRELLAPLVARLPR